MILGTTSNDLLSGTTGNDSILGLNGNDTINSGLGIDTVDGGNGVDVLVVNYSSVSTNITQSSSWVSTSGNTVYYSNVELFNLTGGAGNDNLFGGLFNDTLIGNAGNDTLDGGDGNDSINGGDGNDVIIKGTGIDTIDGGVGIDTLVDGDFSGLSSNLSFNITGGNLGDVILSDGTTLRNLEFITNFTGGIGNDLFRITSTTAVNNSIQGGAGNDTLNAGLGSDTVDGGEGTDLLEVNYSGVSTNITQSTSWVSTSGNTVYYSDIELFNLTGGAGNDNLFGGLFNDTLIGNAGNDTLNGGDGNDSINGGDGDDVITKGTGVDILDGGVGIDTLVDGDFSGLNSNLSFNITGGNLGEVILSDGTTLRNLEFITNFTGGIGNDLFRITSTPAVNNSLQGGTGNDTLNAGLGIDTVDGGEGTDLLEVNYSGVSTNITQSSSWVSTSGNTVYYSDIEQFNLTGGSGHDNLFGGTLNDTLIGNGGNDTLNGGAGNDNISGGDGDDVITKGAGVDILDGGVGIDTLVDGNFSGLSSNLSFNISGGNLGDIILANGTTLKNIELITNFTGGIGNDLFRITSTTPINNSIQGGTGNDTLNAGLGIDTVNGGNGTDLLEVNYSSVSTNITQSSSWVSTSGHTVYYSAIEQFNLTGGTGNDNLFGGAFSDTLVGNAGNDTLSGGLENDILTGGIGADQFVFNTSNSVDLITDFSQNQLDKIVVSASGLGGGLSTGILSAAQFVAGAGVTSATNISQRFMYNTATGGLFFDADGSGTTHTSNQIATLSNLSSLSASDIQVV